MKVTIAKEFDFDAAHFLPKVEDGHKCKRMHGHTYRVQVLLRGDVGADGMVVDYARVAQQWQHIHDALDHRTLNDVPGLDNPTTEVLAPWILQHLTDPRAASVLRGELPDFWNYAVADKVIAVRVFESSTTWCEATR